jgi:hypothetical protein
MALLALHDIEDAHGFCAAIVCRSNLILDYYAREDLTAYLVGECWILSLRYDRGDPQYPPRFSVFATNILRRRTVDWIRKRNGRTRWVFHDRVHERPRPSLVPLDSGLLDTEPAGSGDPATDCSPDLERLLGAGDSQRARDYEALGLDAA